MTAGRTGTSLLQKLFSILPDVYSIHEDEPNYVHCMRQVQTQPGLAVQFLLEKKLPAIASCGRGTYVETSHLFCKGFFEAMVNLGVVPGLVMLKREPRKIAISLLERNSIPSRSAYLLSPGDPNTLPLPDREAMNDYQLCFWYALEIERRQHRYKEYIEQCGGKSFDVTSDELHDRDMFIEMAQTFSLDLSLSAENQSLLSKHSTICNTRHNSNHRKITEITDLEKSEDKVWQSISYYEPFLHDRIEARYQQKNLENYLPA